MLEQYVLLRHWPESLVRESLAGAWSRLERASRNPNEGFRAIENRTVECIELLEGELKRRGLPI